MKYAFIGPSWLLHTLSNQSSYQFALGQELVREGRYLEYYRTVRYKGDFIIVDNGAAEPEEERVSFGRILDRAAEIDADEVILPDVLHQHDATISLMRHAIHKFMIPGRNRFVVPQGEDSTDWKRCMNGIVQMLDGDFATIGIPKVCEDFEGGRVALVDWLASKGYADKYNIHFLGVRNNPGLEVTRAARTGLVRGIDSAAPVAWAQQRRLVSDMACGRFSVDWKVAADSRLVERNIDLMMEWCRAR